MTGHVEYRRHYPRVSVHLEMLADEFREMVEWLEELAPRDGCTRDWRELHDRLFPPEDVTA